VTDFGEVEDVVLRKEDAARVDFFAVVARVI